MMTEKPLTWAHVLSLLGLLCGLITALVTGLATRITGLEDHALAAAVSVEQRLTRIEDKLDRYFSRTGSRRGELKVIREEAGG